MALTTYRQWAYEVSPTWLRGTWGEKFVGAIGFVFDAMPDAEFEAGASNLLDAPTFPSDALALVGNERDIERYPSESDDTYKARVKAAWEAWPNAGTKTGLLSQLDASGFTVTVREMFGVNSINWDGDTANWSRFWLEFSGTGWTINKWGDGRKWGQGVWGASASKAEAHTLLRIVRKWKPANAVAILIVVINDGAYAADQPDGTWGDPANRSDAALYHFDR